MKQATTNKGRFNQLINQAEKINEKLLKLAKECDALARDLEDYGDNFDGAMFDYELTELRNRLDDLASFDLEDAIPEKAKCNF